MSLWAVINEFNSAAYNLNETEQTCSQRVTSSFSFLLLQTTLVSSMELRVHTSDVGD